MSTSQQPDDQTTPQTTSETAPAEAEAVQAEAEAVQAPTQAGDEAARAETEAVLSSVESLEAPAAAIREDDPAASGASGASDGPDDPGVDEASSPDASASPAPLTPTAPGPPADSQQPPSPPADSRPSAPRPAASQPGVPKPSVPKPGAPRPGVPSPSSLPRSPRRAPGRPAQGTAVPLAVPDYSTPLEEAARFARVSEDGHVTLLDHGEEVPVGQFPDATEREALAYFVRKYDDVVAQAMLLEQRTAAGAPLPEIQKTLDHLQDTVDARGMVGDLPALRQKLARVQDALDERRAADKAAHEKAQAEQLAQREAIVAEAEQWAAKEPAQVQWKQASARMTELFDQWKTAQKAGPRLGKSVEDALWKRFRTARTGFDKRRRAFFSQLDAANTEAKAAKEKLIARAEALSTSTDWGPTAGAYRDLMEQWKAAPRASRKEDDALWARFRAAQDTFFTARKAVNAEVDREYGDNLKVKDQILAEGQRLLPFKDVKAGRRALRELRDRWEDAGKVPRKDVSRMEAGFRKLEEALKRTEDEHWHRTNPETRARTDSAVSQLQDTIAGLEKDLAEAQAAGDQKAAAAAQEGLDARHQWLEMLQGSQQG